MECVRSTKLFASDQDRAHTPTMPRNHETGVDEYSRLKKLISVLGAAEGRFSTLFEDRNLNDDLGDIPGYEGLVKDLREYIDIKLYSTVLTC